LNTHLLTRIQSKLQITNPAYFEGQQNTVIIKDNRMYAHKLARFYYTTYDVRRSEDVVHPQTSQCDVMLLGPQAEGTSEETSKTSLHPFLYARVLGIYHVNVVYTGPGMVNYEPMKFDFLWVRWFNVSLDATYSIERQTRQAHLDCLAFPPMAADDAFGFLDPELVLRGCHLLPMFSQGKRLKDGVGLSKLARDNQDWKYYFVNRYDMLKL
jgi:hypothetical protein